ncbi:MAG: flagellar basal-body MS-ring/collar protein FliF [Myxococcota bacterium]
MRLLQRVLAAVTSLEPARRIRLFAAIAVAVVAAAGLSLWAGQETWVPVMSGQGYDQALLAAGAVDKAGIPYRMASPDALEVPQNKLGAARAAIALETDLPGLSEVGDLQVGLTPQAQQWAFLRASESDLARMLNGIDGIVAAQVHVVPRQESLYIGEQRPASASVFVKLEPGATLEAGQVRAIVNLVANSVEGLDPDRVSVADDRGSLLATGDGAGDDGPLGETRKLVEYKAQLEAQVERSIAQALLPVVGYGGGFSATATIDLDLTSSEVTTRQVDATKQAVVSEVVEETASNSTKAGSGGVPGVDANLPENGTPAANPGASASNRSANTVNYAYPTVDEVAKRPAGGVKRLSVAVQVDQARIDQVVTASQGKIDPAVLQKQIDGAVQAAVGYDSARGDVVTVSYLPFAATDWIDGTDPGVAPTTMAMEFLPYAVGLVALAMVFWFVVRPLVAVSIRPLEPEPVVEVIEPEGEEEADPDADLANRLKQLVENFQPVDPRDLKRLVDRESEIAADVLRKWARAK